MTLSSKTPARVWLRPSTAGSCCPFHMYLSLSNLISHLCPLHFTPATPRSLLFLKFANTTVTSGPLHVLSSFLGQVFPLTSLVLYSNIKVTKRYFLTILYKEQPIPISSSTSAPSTHSITWQIQYLLIYSLSSPTRMSALWENSLCILYSLLCLQC